MFRPSIQPRPAPSRAQTPPPRVCRLCKLRRRRSHSFSRLRRPIFRCVSSRSTSTASAPPSAAASRTGSPAASRGTSSACRRSGRRTTTSRARCARRARRTPRSTRPSARATRASRCMRGRRHASTTGFGSREFDAEGRYLEAHFATLTVISIYLPSGSSGPHRQASKFRFLEEFLPHLATAAPPRSRDRPVRRLEHRAPADRPPNWRSNQKNSGFLPEEREWLTRVFDELGFVDVFRRVDPRPDQYTWWSNRGAGVGEERRLAHRLPDRDARDRGQGARRGDLQEATVLRSRAVDHRLRLRVDRITRRRDAFRSSAISLDPHHRPHARPRREAPARRREPHRARRAQGRARRTERLRQVEPVRAACAASCTRTPANVELPAAWTIAHVAQETPAVPAPALEFVLDGDRELRDVERALRRRRQPLPSIPSKPARRSPSFITASTRSAATRHAPARRRCSRAWAFRPRATASRSRASPAAGGCGSTSRRR